MTAQLILPAHAKVNLYLHVTGKREDGYHLLDSLVAFPLAIADQITITEASEFSLHMTGPFSSGLPIGDDNLVIRAARSVAKALNKPLNVSIELEKNIPVGAGLGGGSSDAATLVAGLEQFWNHSLSGKERHSLLLSLGADVPVCYRPSACRFQGIGEIVGSPITLAPLYIVLIWPGHPTFTKDIFAKRAPDYSIPLSAELPDITHKDDLLGFLKSTHNDLQDVAESLYPTIKNARLFLESQSSCLLSRMSGSGSSVFGLFEREEDCRAVIEKIQTRYSDWWAAYSPLSA